MRGLILGTIAVLVLASPAAASISGNDLKKACEGTSRTFAEGYCFGFMTGVLDTLRGADTDPTRKMWCEPPTVTGEQLRAMLQKYLADHPERLHFAASSLIADMYSEAFACKKLPPQ
jgi:hypothetical protein